MSKPTRRSGLKRSLQLAQRTAPAAADVDDHRIAGAPRRDHRVEIAQRDLQHVHVPRAASAGTSRRRRSRGCRRARIWRGTWRCSDSGRAVDAATCQNELVAASGQAFAVDLGQRARIGAADRHVQRRRRPRAHVRARGRAGAGDHAAEVPRRASCGGAALNHASLAVQRVSSADSRAAGGSACQPAVRRAPASARRARAGSLRGGRSHSMSTPTARIRHRRRDPAEAVRQADVPGAVRRRRAPRARRACRPRPTRSMPRRHARGRLQQLAQQRAAGRERAARPGRALQRTRSDSPSHAGNDGVVRTAAGRWRCAASPGRAYLPTVA